MKTLARTAVVALAFAIPLVSSSCDTSDPTNAVMTNGYPTTPDGGDAATQTVVFKVWWSASLFDDPIPAGLDSETNRVVPASDYAYALLVPNWDPSSHTPPSTLIPVRTNEKWSASRGDTLHITISDETVIGNCAAGKPLSQDDADFITQRIFPGNFANVVYDAPTCASTPLPADGGADTGG